MRMQHVRCGVVYTLQSSICQRILSGMVALTQPPAFRLYDTTPLLSLTSSANGEPRLRESARSLERSHRRVGAACALTGNPVSGAACRRVSMYSVLLVALKQSRR